MKLASYCSYLQLAFCFFLLQVLNAFYVNLHVIFFLG